MVFFCLFGRDLGQKVWHLFIATYLSIRSLSANKVTLTLAWHVSGKSSGWGHIIFKTVMIGGDQTRDAMWFD